MDMTTVFILGGDTTNYKELYHYTHVIPNEILAGAYFTEFKADTVELAKEMTSSTNNLRYRVTVKVNRKSEYTLFRDIGTKHRTYMALEYRSKIDIPKGYLKVDPIS